MSSNLSYYVSNKTLAKAVRVAMIVKDLKGTEVAKALDIEYREFNKIVNYKRYGKKSIQRLKDICKYLGVSFKNKQFNFIVRDEANMHSWINRARIGRIKGEIANGGWYEKRG